MVSKVLLKGITVSPGVVRGKVRVVSTPEELDEVVYGEILVLPNSHPMYAIGVMKASALLCEDGGKLSHICIVAMEMGIPCITQVKGATTSLHTGDQVYVDATEGAVYVNE
jgi:pyruvate,water dikinase